MRKFQFLLVGLLIYILSSCVSHSILSFEDDDVYYTKKDLVSKDKMEEHKNAVRDEYEKIYYYAE